MPVAGVHGARELHADVAQHLRGQRALVWQFEGDSTTAMGTDRGYVLAWGRALGKLSAAARTLPDGSVASNPLCRGVASVFARINSGNNRAPFGPWHTGSSFSATDANLSGQPNQDPFASLTPEFQSILPHQPRAAGTILDNEPINTLAPATRVTVGSPAYPADRVVNNHYGIGTVTADASAGARPNWAAALTARCLAAGRAGAYYTLRARLGGGADGFGVLASSTRTFASDDLDWDVHSLAIGAAARTNLQVGWASGAAMRGELSVACVGLTIPSVAGGWTIDLLNMQGGLNSWHAATLLISHPLVYLAGLLRMWLAAGDGQPTTVVIVLNHMLNDPNAGTVLSVGPNPTASNTPAGMIDNQVAYVRRWKEAWALLESQGLVGPTDRLRFVLSGGNLTRNPSTYTAHRDALAEFGDLRSEPGVVTLDRRNWQTQAEADGAFLADDVHPSSTGFLNWGQRDVDNMIQGVIEAVPPVSGGGGGLARKLVLGLSKGGRS